MSTTKLNSNQLDATVYNKDNLIAGENITIEDKTISNGIDEDTLVCLHFNDNLINSSQYASGDSWADGKSPETDTNIYYTEGKFGKAIMRQLSREQYRLQNSLYYPLYDDITLEFWQQCVGTSTNAGSGTIGLWSETGASSAANTYISGLGYYRGWNIYVSTTGGLYQWETPLTTEQVGYINQNGYNHLALVCSKGNYTKFYINGHLIINDTTHTTLCPYIPSEITHGELYLAFGNNHAIDEVRLSKCIRYTGDTFTPPASEFSESVVVKSINSNNSVQSTNVSNIVRLTQDEYDALVQAGTVDPNTFYLIVQEESN